VINFVRADSGVFVMLAKNADETWVSDHLLLLITGSRRVVLPVCRTPSRHRRTAFSAPIKHVKKISCKRQKSRL
jgi:hypothetical protein